PSSWSRLSCFANACVLGQSSLSPFSSASPYSSPLMCSLLTSFSSPPPSPSPRDGDAARASPPPRCPHWRFFPTSTSVHPTFCSVSWRSPSATRPRTERPRLRPRSGRPRDPAPPGTLCLRLAPVYSNAYRQSPNAEVPCPPATRSPRSPQPPPARSPPGGWVE